MSIDTCVDCGQSVDTDTDDKAYVIIDLQGYETECGACHCPDCRVVDTDDGSGDQEAYQKEVDSFRLSHSQMGLI